MQAFKQGQRVLVAAVNDEGKQTGEPLYRSAAIVQAQDGNPDSYMIATLNHDDEVNLFVGYFSADRLQLNTKNETLVEGLQEELDATSEDDWDEEFDTDGTEQVYAVIRDDLDADYFDPSRYDGDVQMVSVVADGIPVLLVPSESFAKAFEYVGAANFLPERIQEFVKRFGALWAKPSASAFDVTEHEIATFIPAAMPEKLILDRDGIVMLGQLLLDHDGVALVRAKAQFHENVTNEVQTGLAAIPQTIFEPVHIILNNLRDAIVEMSDEARLTLGSDVALVFEPVVLPVAEWENFGFDTDAEMVEDEDEDEDDLDDEDEGDEEDEAEGELADESVQPKPGTMTEEIANNVQATVSAFADSLPEVLGAPIEIVSTNTVFSADLALVTIAVATKEDAAEVGPIVDALESAVSTLLVGEPDFTAKLMEVETDKLIAFANYFGLNADDSMTKEEIVERINDNVDHSEIEEFFED